ncbi:putative lccl domain protein [Phaeomoniella chlamydospora]|uniref:Putative lccl domain protein n=1 Tax=Phaeomoniella chlamydospora TaxID=158046 RepID=A0A0G2E3W6_PHACM|nr:putative lccl domain protein [Phaeomoniella chlamydospora]
MIFFTVALGTDPPDYSDYNDVISVAFGRFLPSAFIATIIYIYSIRRTLTNLSAQFEKTMLWLTPCYIGALNNYTFDNLPLQRLTPHDLRSQPGAITTLVFILIILISIALGQAWCFRIEGRLPQYLKFYSLLAVSLVIFVLIPDLNLRIHHYILALLLLPGTSLQTRPSLVYQGLLIGLFISGVARWGYASILESDAVLFQDGPVGGSKPHSFPHPIIPDQNSISFDFSSWNFTSSPVEPPRLSILINDVERYRTSSPSSRANNGPEVLTFNYTRPHVDEVEYFRFAYVKSDRMGRDKVGDYSDAVGVWWGNGTWDVIGEGEGGGNG